MQHGLAHPDVVWGFVLFRKSWASLQAPILPCCDQLLPNSLLFTPCTLLTCPTMVLASTSARRGPLSMSAALRKIWARSWTGFRSHSFLAAKAALMALLMRSCVKGKGSREEAIPQETQRGQ